MTAHDQIAKDIAENDVVLYMKGTPVFPQCGFSAVTVQILSQSRREVQSRRCAERPRNPSGHQGILELADHPPALCEGRIRRRLRHPQRDVSRPTSWRPSSPKKASRSKTPKPPEHRRATAAAGSELPGASAYPIRKVKVGSQPGMPASFASAAAESVSLSQHLVAVHHLHRLVDRLRGEPSPPSPPDAVAAMPAPPRCLLPCRSRSRTRIMPSTARSASCVSRVMASQPASAVFASTSGSIFAANSSQRRKPGRVHRHAVAMRVRSRVRRCGTSARCPPTFPDRR